MVKSYYSDGIQNIGFVGGLIRMEMGIVRVTDKPNDKERNVDISHIDAMNLEGFYRSYASMAHLYQKLIEKGLVPDEIKDKIEDIIVNGDQDPSKRQN